MKLRRGLIPVWLLIFSLIRPNQGQRSLLHWKKDLEYRLQSYSFGRQEIEKIIDSSIYQQESSVNRGQTRVISGVKIRFSDLIINNGALRLESHVARPSMAVMMNKTQTYVNMKLNELYQVRSQLEEINRQVNDPRRRFIYKGRSASSFLPQINLTYMNGTWSFKRFMYARRIQSERILLKSINFSNVDQILQDVYMENPLLGALDSQKRIFFEGRKTFWQTKFERSLRSGCCDRLRPLHTNRMMIRTENQTIQAPLLFHTNDPYNRQPVLIRNLYADQLYNKILAVGMIRNRLDDIGLVPSIAENIISLPYLVSTRQSNQAEIMKTIVFRSDVKVDEVQVMAARPVIGFATNPLLHFDLFNDNYLLKYSSTRNNSQAQRVLGSFVVNSETHFVANLEAVSVNKVINFNRFVEKNIVRIDRAEIISSPVFFDALLMANKINFPTRPQQSVQIMAVDRALEVAWVNGMKLPQDIILLPSTLNSVINIRGSRIFQNTVVMTNSVQVGQLVNNIKMPSGVIPLHLNDSDGFVGASNLWFTDGINVRDVTIQSGQFDDIRLNEVIDAQGFIMQSVTSLQPDGSHLIRAPLQIMNLTILGEGPSQGLLNGFRPQDLLELSRFREQPIETVFFSKKTFLATVEADDCSINEINQISGWTNHLIRIDQPTVQTVHTRLAFIQPPMQQRLNKVVSAQALYVRSSSVKIDRINVEFYPNNNPTLYKNNMMISREFYMLERALLRAISNRTEGRYRVLDQVRLMNPNSQVNGVLLSDIVTLDQPFNFADKFVMVGKVDLRGNLEANRITSNYPIDIFDLEQFNRYRIPVSGSRAPIRLNHLVLGTNNQASFVQSRMLNGIPFNDFANSIMSLTRPQTVEGSMMFAGPTNLEGFVKTHSALNGIQNFRQFAHRLKDAKYLFENGLQCNSVLIKS